MENTIFFFALCCLHLICMSPALSPLSKKFGITKQNAMKFIDGCIELVKVLHSPCSSG